MRTILAVNLQSDTNNLGDNMCCPLDYVSIGNFNIQKVDIRDYAGGDAVIGGGGLLHPALDDMLYAALKTKAKRVIWGIGTNYHERLDPVHPHWLSEFDLVGLRDFCQQPLPDQARYIPCPSCLSPEFDMARPAPAQEAVIYQHTSYPVAVVKENLPCFNNAGKTADDLRRALDFIGSAKVVITSSYHGAYWALLLGRTPILVEPFSNRFYFFRTPLPVITKTDCDWKAKAAGFQPQPDYLARCRKLNLDFLGSVKTLFSTLEEHE